MLCERGSTAAGSLSGRMTQFPGINTLLGQAASAKEFCDVAAGVGFVLLSRALSSSPSPCVDSKSFNQHMNVQERR